LIGDAFALGQGVPQDYVAAIKWYRMAAKQGDPGAQSALAFMYDVGRGVPQDLCGCDELVSNGSRTGRRQRPSSARLDVRQRSRRSSGLRCFGLRSQIEFLREHCRQHPTQDVSDATVELYRRLRKEGAT
jgi:TPR repeat protein